LFAQIIDANHRLTRSLSAPQDDCAGGMLNFSAKNLRNSFPGSTNNEENQPKKDGGKLRLS